MSRVPLNLSIDEKLKRALKHIAIDEGLSASELVEDYIKAIQKNKNVIKAIRDIEKNNKNTYLKKIKCIFNLF